MAGNREAPAGKDTRPGRQPLVRRSSGELQVDQPYPYPIPRCRTVREVGKTVTIEGGQSRSPDRGWAGRGAAQEMRKRGGTHPLLATSDAHKAWQV
jgi:hypothetical protein